MSTTSSTVSSELHFPAGDGTVPLDIKVSPRARAMRLRVDQRTGGVVLTIPRRASRKKAVEWAMGHRAWVEEVLARIPSRSPIAPDATISYLGIPHRIDWLADRPRTVRVEDGRLIVGGPLDGLEQRMLRWLKREALALLAQETREYAARAGVTVDRIGVGDPVSRWGSCSSSGTIRYSWRLILAPVFVRRATVAHEVAHRAHMNHGPHFHALVRAIHGEDPAPARAWLRREGAALHRIGGKG